MSDTSSATGAGAAAGASSASEDTAASNPCTAVILHPLFPDGPLSSIVPRLRKFREVVVPRPPPRPPLLFRLHQADVRRDVGLTTWPSGILLAQVLAAQDWAGRTLLELGCGGSPLASMTVALSGGAAVATDGSAEPLKLAATNVAANVPPPANAYVHCVRCRWGDADDADAVRAALAPLPPAVTVAAADVLYAEGGLAPLAAALAAFTRATAYVAYQVRLHDFEARFWEDVLPRAGFDVSVACEEVVQTMTVRVMKCARRPAAEAT